MPAWRGDGLLLAYAASPLAGGSFDIWTVDPTGGKPRRVATGPAEQIVPAFSARRHGHVPHARAGRAVPGEDERRGHAGGRAARAAARLRPARAVPAHHHRHEARLRLRDRQHRRRAGVGARQPPGAGRRDACAAARPDVGRHACARTRTRAASATRPRPPTRTGTCSTSSATSSARSTATLVVRDRKSGFCLADHYGLAKRRVTAFTGAHFFGNCAASNPQRALRRAGHLDRLHRPLSRPLPRPEPRAPRRARRGLLARPPRQPDAAARGDRLHEQRRLAPHPAHAGRAASRASRRCARCEGSAELLEPSAAGSAKRSGRRSGSSSLRPSRSSRNALIPSARAPSMSSS